MFEGAQHRRRPADGGRRHAAHLVKNMVNWLLHGVCTAEEVDAALVRIAAKDAQNAGDPLYRPMAGHDGTSRVFQVARALVLEGLTQPNGYTEPLLHRYHQGAKES
jgi:malate synthase